MRKGVGGRGVAGIHSRQRAWQEEAAGAAAGADVAEDCPAGAAGDTAAAADLADDCAAGAAGDTAGAAVLNQCGHATAPGCEALGGTGAWNVCG